MDTPPILFLFYQNTNKQNCFANFSVFGLFSSKFEKFLVDVCAVNVVSA